MKLYKYRDINDAWPFLDILFSKRLYLAPLDRLNDPMELKQHDARHVLEALFGAEMDGSRPISHEYTQVATMLDLIGPGDQFGSHAEFSLALLTSPYSRVCSLTTNPHSTIIHLASGFALGPPCTAPRRRTAQGTATMTFQAGTGSGSWAWNQDWYMHTSLA